MKNSLFALTVCSILLTWFGIVADYVSMPNAELKDSAVFTTQENGFVAVNDSDSKPYKHPKKADYRQRIVFVKQEQDKDKK